MKNDLPTLLANLNCGKAARLLLVFGDDLQVQEACRAVLDLLVAENQRGFNLERFDGRVAPWEQIEASLMTPPFLPGKKLLWIENAPYFFSRGQKGELGEKILELWRGGKRDEAVQLLMDLLVIEGWDQEQWDRLEPSSVKALATLLGADSGEAKDDIEGLVNYGKSRVVDLGKNKSSQGHRLPDLLDEGLPEWAFLLLTAVQVDRRTRLYKRFEEIGAVLNLSLERDRSGRINRDSLMEFVDRRLRQSGKNIAPQAREMILARAGDELRGLQQELDKLLLFVGDRSAISSTDVAAVFTDQGDGWIFDLTRAIGERDAGGALFQLARLLGQGEHPLRILATVASEVRRLLAARQLLETDFAGVWKHNMNFQRFQQTILAQGAPLLTRSPYTDYLCFQRAERFSLLALRAYMDGIFDADLRLKSSGSDARWVLEKLFLRMCVGGQAANQQTRSRAGL